MNEIAFIPSIGLIVVGAGMLFVLHNKTTSEQLLDNRPANRRILSVFAVLLALVGVTLLFLTLAEII